MLLLGLHPATLYDCAVWATREHQMLPSDAKLPTDATSSS